MSFFGSRVVGLGLLIVGGRGVGLLAVASVAGFLWSASAAASTTTFSYTGGEQTYTVAGGVSSLSIVAIGAQGGAQTSCEAAVCPPGDQGRQQKPAPRVISCRIAPETLIPPPQRNESFATREIAVAECRGSARDCLSRQDESGRLQTSQGLLSFPAGDAPGARRRITQPGDALIVRRAEASDQSGHARELARRWSEGVRQLRADRPDAFRLALQDHSARPLHHRVLALSSRSKPLRCTPSIAHAPAKVLRQGGCNRTRSCSSTTVTSSVTPRAYAYPVVQRRIVLRNTPVRHGARRGKPSGKPIE